MILALPFRANCPTNADRFRQIFRDHWDRWCDLRLEDEVPADQRAYVRETVQRMMLCRDPDAGYARYVCPTCGFDLRVPFSCKSRFCPSCGKVRVDEWVTAITHDLLEVPHLHLTLTIDDALRPFFHAERALLNDLLQVAAQAVKEVLTDLDPGVRVGMIYVTHSFGRDLGFKPHVHLVMTKGGLKDDAWVEIAEVPGGRLAAKWRYLLCQRLRQRRPDNTALQRVIAQTYTDHHGFQAKIMHVYDFGTESWTTLKRISVREGQPTTLQPIALMVRNKLPEVTCIECGAPAKWLCIECVVEEDRMGFLCAKHRKTHEHDNYGEPLKVVNSPRLGLCGYDGPAKPPY